MKNSKLGIIGGCGSSGTTLLAHLISRHPRIASGPEFNCFNHREIYDCEKLRRCYQSLLNGHCSPFGYIDVSVFMTNRAYYGIVEDKVGQWVSASSSAADFMGQIADHLRSHLNKPMFVEKSPTNVYSFGILARQHPDIPLIHVIRDGRDVAASLQRRGFNLFAAGTRWLFDTMAGLAGRQSPNYLEVFYEDLVKNPVEVLKKIFDHLGVDPEEDVLGNGSKAVKGVYTQDWKDIPEPLAWKQTPSDPISPASVGQYKTEFNEKQLYLLDRITLNRKAAARLGLGSAPFSFKQALHQTGYEPSYYTPETDLSRKFREMILQLNDYNRMLSRAHSNRRWRLPSRMSYIASWRSS